MLKIALVLGFLKSRKRHCNRVSRFDSTFWSNGRIFSETLNISIFFGRTSAPRTVFSDLFTIPSTSTTDSLISVLTEEKILSSTSPFLAVIWHVPVRSRRIKNLISLCSLTESTQPPRTTFSPSSKFATSAAVCVRIKPMNI